jgi:hypothetical protein
MNEPSQLPPLFEAACLAATLSAVLALLALVALTIVESDQQISSVAFRRTVRATVLTTIHFLLSRGAAVVTASGGSI